LVRGASIAHREARPPRAGNIYFALGKPRMMRHPPRVMSAPAARPDCTFASDNTAGLAPEAWAALEQANRGPVPSYGDDEWTTRAKQLLAGVFERDCEVFFVFNGTAANALALAQLCRSHHSIICHECSHVDTDECSAPEFFSGGSKVIPVAGSGAKLASAGLTPVLLRNNGVHSPKPGALSLTQATEWGTLYTPAELRVLADLAKSRGLAVQMDGARFANAAAALAARGLKPADLTWRAGVDVLCLGGTKNGMNTTEAVIFFDRDRARDFDYKVKQAGQLASKARFAAAQWCGMLEDGAWLRHAAHANAMAQKLADGLRPLPGVKLIVEPEANGVFAELPQKLASAVAARGWQFHRFIGEHGYRFMCSWATQPADVDRLLQDFRTAAAG